MQFKKRGIIKTVGLNIQAGLAVIETSANATLVAAEVLQSVIEDLAVGSVIAAGHIRKNVNSYLKEEFDIDRKQLMGQEDPIDFLAQKLKEKEEQEQSKESNQ